MEILGMIVIVVGILIAFVGGIMFYIVAFKESILWGFGCLIIPFASLIFLIMFWHDAKKPFAISLVGSFIAVIGFVMAPGVLG